MKCWSCGNEMFCGCTSCANVNSFSSAFEGITYKLENDIATCGYCGFSLHLDGWLELEFEDHAREHVGSFANKKYDDAFWIESFQRMRIPLSFEYRTSL